MGWLFGSKKNDKPQYTTLQVQTSTSTLAIPIVWGQTRIAPNLIFYANFQAIPGKGGKGAKGGMLGGGHQPTTYTYRADLALALCEGPIHGIGITWHNRSAFGHVDLAIPIWDQADNTVSYLWTFNGTADQTTWGYFAGLYPNEALAFPWTAYLAAATFDLGSSATIGELNCEVQGPLYSTGTNGMDADPAQVISDFLISPQYGAQFDPAFIDGSTLFSNQGQGATIQDYCKAVGICFSPALINQEQASSILTRWLQICNTAAVWSGQYLRFVPYGDTVLAAGTLITANPTLTIPQNPDNIPNGFGFGVVNIQPPGQFVADLGVKYATQNYGIPLIYIGATIPVGAGAYGRIGTQYFFSQYDIGIGVTISYQYTSAGGYTPNLQPLFSLTDDDFVDEGGDNDPITVERIDPFTLPTVQRIECLSRSNQYAGVTVEARDQSAAEIFGPRVGTTVSAHEICDELNVAPTIAQAILQRALYVRAKFKFKTDWTFCVLDPMDIIAINDATLGLENYPVRIVTIEEDDNGFLQFECEELISGVSTPAQYTTASAHSLIINQQQPANPINSPPLVYQPPSTFSGGVAEALLGVSSSLPQGGADPNFGGANVYASLDGATYTYITQIVGAVPQGFLTAHLATAHGFDQGNTLSIDLRESGGTLQSTTEAAAIGGATLCLVGNELLAFETATLTAPNTYDLTGLARGLYGTTPANVPAGTSFSYLAAQTVVIQPLDAQWIGKTVYLKFQAVNIFFQGGQPLDACQVFIFTPTPPSTQGSSLDVHPIADALASGMPVDLGSVVDEPPTVTDDFGGAAEPVSGAVDLGSVLAVDPIASMLKAALPNGTVDFGFVYDPVTVTGNFASAGSAPDDFIDLMTGSIP